MHFYFTQCSLVITVLVLVQLSSEKSTESGRNGKLEQEKTRSKREVLNDQILFPDNNDDTVPEVDNRGQVGPLGVTPSPCPDGNPFCETANDYPTNHIKAVMERQPRHLLQHFYDEEDNVILNKQGTTPEIRQSLCASTERKMFPKKGENSEGLFYVVNDDKYKQGVKVDTCAFRRSESEAHCQIPGSLAIGYKALCVQKTIDRVLVVLDNHNSSGVVLKPFPIPSCCSCVLVDTTMGMLGFSSSVGNGPTNSSIPRKAKNSTMSSSP